MLSTAADPLAIPAFLKIPAEQRAAAWAKRPPRPMPRFAEVQRAVDAVSVAFRAQLEADYKAEADALLAFKRPDTKKAKAYAAAQDEKKTSRGLPAEPRDLTGLRWGRTKSGKYDFVPDVVAPYLQGKGRGSVPLLPPCNGEDQAKKPGATGGSAREREVTPLARGSSPRRSTTTAAPKVDNLAVLMTMLQRPEGATKDEIAAATGWQPHTAGARIGGVRKTQPVVATVEKRGTVYRTERLA